MKETAGERERERLSVFACGLCQWVRTAFAAGLWLGLGCGFRSFFCYCKDSLCRKEEDPEEEEEWCITMTRVKITSSRWC